MEAFKQFKVKETGEIVTYPAHFADHPVFGLNLEPYNGECEVDKVVVEGHELPVEQRIARVAVDNEVADTPKKSTRKENK